MSSLPAAFRRFWWGEAVSGFGGAFTTLALQTLVVVSLHGGPVEVGWLNAAALSPYLVLGLVVGALVDRVRRRPVMVSTDVARAVLLCLVPLTFSLGLLDLRLLLVLAALLGTASLLNDAASMSFVPRLVPVEQLQRAHARLDGAGAVASTAGPAAAGALVRFLGAPAAVLVDALTYLFSAVTVITLRDVVEPGHERRPAGLGALLREVREGVGWVYGRSGLRRLAVATHVWFLAQTVLLVLTAPYALVHLHLTPFQLGLVLSVAGVGALVGAWRSTAVGARLGTGGAIVCCHLVSAVGALVMAVAAAVPVGWAAAGVLAVGQLAHGWAMGVSNSHEMSFRQTLTPDALQARTNTTMRSLNRGVVVVASPVVGYAAAGLGLVPVLGGAVLVFGTSALLLARSPLRRAGTG